MADQKPSSRIVLKFGAPASKPSLTPSEQPMPMQPETTVTHVAPVTIRASLTPPNDPLKAQTTQVAQPINTLATNGAPILTQPTSSMIQLQVPQVKSGVAQQSFNVAQDTIKPAPSHPQVIKLNTAPVQPMARPEESKISIGGSSLISFPATQTNEVSSLMAPPQSMQPQQTATATATKIRLPFFQQAQPAQAPRPESIIAINTATSHQPAPVMQPSIESTAIRLNLGPSLTPPSAPKPQETAIKTQLNAPQQPATNTGIIKIGQSVTLKAPTTVTKPATQPQAGHVQVAEQPQTQSLVSMPPQTLGHTTAGQITLKFGGSQEQQPASHLSQPVTVKANPITLTTSTPLPQQNVLMSAEANSNVQSLANNEKLQASQISLPSEPMGQNMSKSLISINFGAINQAQDKKDPSPSNENKIQIQTTPSFAPSAPPTSQVVLGSTILPPSTQPGPTQDTTQVLAPTLPAQSLIKIVMPGQPQPLMGPAPTQANLIQIPIAPAPAQQADTEMKAEPKEEPKPIKTAITLKIGAPPAQPQTTTQVQPAAPIDVPRSASNPNMITFTTDAAPHSLNSQNELWSQSQPQVLSQFAQAPIQEPQAILQQPIVKQQPYFAPTQPVPGFDIQQANQAQPSQPIVMPTASTAVVQGVPDYSPVAAGQQTANMVQPISPAPAKREKIAPRKANILEFYTVKKRHLAFELDPQTKSYRGQLKIQLALKMTESKTQQQQQESLLAQAIEQGKALGQSRVQLEAAVLAKQLKVCQVWLLNKDPASGELKKEMAQKFAEGNLADPVEQAKVNPLLFGSLSRHLYQLEDVQRKQVSRQLTEGTVPLKLKKKLFQLKCAEKIRPEVFLMIDFICDHVTDIGGVRRIAYQKSLADQLAQNQSQTTSEFYVTGDEPNQSTSWLPQLAGSQRIASAWSLQFLVPKDFTVLASGKLVDRSEEDSSTLLEYEISDAERTVPDCIGFVACPLTLTTPFDVQGKKDIAAAHFLSRQKQSYFSPKLASEMAEYICSVMSQRHYPCKDTKVVFLPNLFPSKFPKQAYNFAGGLHLLDQELLFRPNQIDKRHHLYKHLTASLTFAFFGGRVREATHSDSWLFVAIRERIGDRFTKSKCGALLYRYQVMKRIEKLYKLVKEGVEAYPLQRSKQRDQEPCPELKGLGCPDPLDQAASDVFYRKCGLVMQMIELKIGDLLDSILKEMYTEGMASKERVLSLESFRAAYKKVCGIRSKEIFSNWVFSTSCPKLTLNYEFNKRYNSLDLTLKQESAAVSSMRVHKNLQTKIDKIFGMAGAELDQELLGEVDPNETFIVDQKAACRRWFTGNVNVVICQADGGGGEILKQQHKMLLKPYKSTVSANITLQGRVRRTQNRKKDLDYLPPAALNEPQPRGLGPGGRPISGLGGPGRSQKEQDMARSQAAQLMLNQDVQKFEMNEFELEDFPAETKNIFRKELDNNPVLWIRVDPDMEYIRKVKVVQKKRNNWLFQLLREQDIVGQIEAVRQLHKYNEDLVYDILKTVSRNENYFFKVRKEVLKAMHKMEISVFNKYLSHEAYLLRYFNQKNFDEGTGFYRENSFQNLLQYYLDRSVLKHIAKCKEEKLVLTQDSRDRLEELQSRQSRQAQDENMEDVASEKTPQKDVSGDQSAMPNTTISINFVQNQLAGVETSAGRAKGKAKVDDSYRLSDYRLTTDKVAQMLLKVLEQNDNSENYFDDSFLVRDILASLGRLDNLNFMVQIARELYRQFKLDQISNSSPSFAITCGAIKGYFNMRKQIFRFIYHKKPHIDPSDPFAQHRRKLGAESGHLAVLQGSRDQKQIQQAQEDAERDQLIEAEAVLDQMKEEIDTLLMEPQTPLQLRLFIFEQEIRNIVFYRSLPLTRALQVIVDAVFNLQQKMEIRFALFCLRDLVLFLDSARFVGKINFCELHVDSEATKQFVDTLWSLLCLPHGYLTSEMAYWVKRLMNRLHGKVMPKFLINQNDLTLDPQILKIDELWARSEDELAAEEQKRINLAEQQKQEQKNKALMAAQGVIQPDQAMMIAPAQQQQQPVVAPTQSSTVLTIGRSQTVKVGGSKKRALEQSEKQSLVQIRPKIKATNNPLTEHSAANIMGGDKPQTKISIMGSSIRLTTVGAETKVQNAIQSMTNQSILEGKPSLASFDQASQQAVVHLGPAIHTSITLPAKPQQPSVVTATGPSLIVLPGKSADAVSEADQSHTGQPLQAETNVDMQVDSDEDESEMADQSRSLIRIKPKMAEQNEHDDSDDDDVLSGEEELIRPAKEHQQHQHLPDDASFAAGEDNADAEMKDEGDYSEAEAGPDADDSSDQEQVGAQEGDSVYDPFAEEKFDDQEMQKCWLILGKLYYHYEVTDFLDPVTPDTFGDMKMYEEYCSVVAQPMDISTVMAKMRALEYSGKHAFRRDVELIFDNCREFNEAGTEIVHCANSLTLEFRSLWQEFQM